MAWSPPWCWADADGRADALNQQLLGWLGGGMAAAGAAGGFALISGLMDLPLSLAQNLSAWSNAWFQPDDVEAVAVRPGQIH